MFGSIAQQVDESELGRVQAMISSMTRGERADPDRIDKSRATRIARGSGRRTREVLDLVQRFGQMRDMMGSLGGGGLLGRVPGLGRLAGAGSAADPMALLQGAGAPPARSSRTSDRKRERDKRKRKQARKDRKKARRR
jgi:signal recognition particle subunit SRP54